VQRTGRHLATTFTSRKVPGTSGEVYVTLSRVGPVLRRLLAAEIIAVAVALALVAGLGPTVAARALRPLKRVSAVAGELRRGELGSRVNLPGLKSRRDEVGEVATSFDEMARDLERLFEAEHESKESLRRFLADASHELRTPLTSVLGYLDVLVEGGDADPAFRDRALRAMQDEAERMSRLVDDLLALARLDTRREDPKEPVDLAALAREVAGTYPGCRIEVSARDGPVTVLAGPESLRRVVSNLLSNAVRHTPSDKDIRVCVKSENREAVLRVDDDGVGIPKEALPHIFERFYRVESARTGEGSGLGLAIVKETVEFLGGMVEVESAPDAGSSFTVRLPLSEKPSQKN
jgi:two-component system OmpR family sensor kinase